MGDVLPQKRQTVVDRLRRRVDHYRRHQLACSPRYNVGLNGLLEHHHQDTMLLRQKFLEAKAKKANKKGDHHKSGGGGGAATAAAAAATAVKDSSVIAPTGGNLGSKYKRVADVAPPTPSPHMDPVTKTSEDAIGDHQSKLTSGVPNSTSSSSSSTNNNNNQKGNNPGNNAANSNNGNQNLDQNLTQFSVEIVQQFTSPGPAQGQQIQTNVTVTTVSGSTASTNIKTSDSPVPNNLHAAAAAATNVGSMSKDKNLDGVESSNKPIITPILSTVECKQEPKFDLDCGGGNATSLGSVNSEHGGVGGVSSSFADSFSNFIDDSNDDDINLNFNSDTFNYLMDALPQDLMTAYLERLDQDEALLDDLKSFGADLHHHHHHHNQLHHNHHQSKEHNNSGGGAAIPPPPPPPHHHHHHHHHLHHPMNEMNKMCDTADHVNPSGMSSQRNHFVQNHNNNNTSGSLLFSNGGVGGVVSNNQMNANVNPMGRIPPYGGGALGLDFTLKEPSPAAQTLKQMAEQHQNMQQKQQQQQQQQQQQHLGMSMNASSPFSTDFNLVGGGASPYGTSASNMDFLAGNGVGGGGGGNGFMHAKGAPNNSSFPFGPMNPLSSMNNAMLKRDPMFRPRQPLSANNHRHHHHHNHNHHHLAAHLDMRKQQQQQQPQAVASPVTLQSRLGGGADQKPGGVGHSPGQSPVPATAGASPRPCSTPTGSPLSFGATKPLTHFNDPQQTSVVNGVGGGASSPGGIPPQMSGQFLVGGGGGAVPPGVSPQQTTSTQQQQPPQPNFMNQLPRHGGLQASQAQQMQVNQNSQQMQVSQGQHLQLGDLKGQQQQQQVMYNFSQQQQANVGGVDEQYQLNVSQAQSVTFGGGNSDGPMSVNRLGGGPGSGLMMSQTSSQDHVQQQSHPRMMHQQQQMVVARHHMLEKQKMSQQQQQQQLQQQPQQQQIHQQQRSASQFVNRPPPPEYNAQVLPIGHQMVAGQQQQQQQPTVMGMMNQMHVNQTQVFAAAASNATRSMFAQAPSASTAAAAAVSATNVRPKSSSSKGTSSSPMMTNVAPLPINQQQQQQMSMNGCGSNNNNNNNNAIRPTAYPSSSMLRDSQRPPNVNIGPDGLNIGNRGMTSQEWRQMMVQNQAKFQSLGGAGGGSPSNMTRSPSMSTLSAPNNGNMAPQQRAYQATNQMNHVMPPMPHQTQAAMMRGGLVGSGGAQMNMMQQQQQQRQAVNQMQNRLPPQQQQQQQASSGPMMTVQMSSSVTMSTGGGVGVGAVAPTPPTQLAASTNHMTGGFGLSNANNVVGANTSAAAAASSVVSNDFSFDFFDSLSGPLMDGSGSGGFGPNVDADLLNSFDSVMQNGSSGLNLLESL